MSLSPENHDLPPSKPAAVELTKEQKNFRLSIGFLGFYLVNSILLTVWLAETARLSTIYSDPPQRNWFISFLPFLVNMGALIIFSRFKSTRWVAFGILVAIALALALSLIVGIFVYVLCYMPKG